MQIIVLSDAELLARMPILVSAERAHTADVIEHLLEIDARQLYLGEACSSLTSYCIERLGYSEDEASKRARVARLARRFPAVLAELRAGAIHLSGLALLAPHVTEENCAELVASARHQSKRNIESVLAARFPKSDTPEVIQPLSVQLPLVVATGSDASFRPGAETRTQGVQRSITTTPVQDQRFHPLSAQRWHVQFTAGAELARKLEEARALLSHAVPSGELATIFERALDALLERETKRRLGVAVPRKRRAVAPGSRHVPVHVARQVWARDEHQCAFVDAQGRRCTARRFLTLEHREPYALGGAPTLDNLKLFCAAHNLGAAIQFFGPSHIAAKRIEGLHERAAPECSRGSVASCTAFQVEQRRSRAPADANGAAAADRNPSRNETLAKVSRALNRLGFRDSAIRSALAELPAYERTPDALLRAALARLSS